MNRPEKLPPPPPGRAASRAVPADRMAVLFAVMLVAAAGNTAMQSTLPAIAAQLRLSDVWVSLAFSWSALLWVITAPRWARMSDRRGRKLLMTWGTLGFVASMGLCGAVLWLGLNGFVAPIATFALFALFRSLYGGIGSAAPPAVQAYVAARTERKERAKALALLASSFGLGTVIGPATAHWLVFWPFGLAGPLVVFAGIGAAVILLLRWRLPGDTPRFAAKGRISAYPSSGSDSRRAHEEEEDDGLDGTEHPPIAWLDRRLLPWMTVGLVGGHAQAVLLGVVGFLVRDRLGLYDQPDLAVQAIGTVMFVGAMATLLAQWGLIPLLDMGPRSSVLWGGALAAAGVVLTGMGQNPFSLATGYALASLGFGLFRPGFTAGASLAVERRAQGDVAGKIASVNGAAYIAAPAVGVALYDWYEPIPFALIAAALAGLVAWSWRALRVEGAEED